MSNDVLQLLLFSDCLFEIRSSLHVVLLWSRAIRF